MNRNGDNVVHSCNLRKAFLDEMLALTREGKNLVTLDCEVGTATYTTNYGASYPDYHYNFGVAEQNMFGIAADMVSTGITPFAAIFAVFTTMRAYEMVRPRFATPT